MPDELYGRFLDSGQRQSGHVGHGGCPGGQGEHVNSLLDEKDKAARKLKTISG
jgi:hypothetical protein